MDSLQTDAALPADDLSALAWVQDELRKSLDAAHKALNRALRIKASAAQSDVDALDPSVLRTARQQIHQGVGALELAGLPAGAALLRASEALVQKFVGRPASLSADAVRDIERALFALLDYMGRRIGGKAGLGRRAVPAGTKGPGLARGRWAAAPVRPVVPGLALAVARISPGSPGRRRASQARREHGRCLRAWPAGAV